MVIIELIRMDGMQSLYTLAHWGFTFSRHIRNFMKSASASSFCSFYPTFNEIQAYVRLTVLQTQQICSWKMRNEHKCVTLSSHSDVAQYSNLMDCDAMPMDK